MTHHVRAHRRKYRCQPLWILRLKDTVCYLAGMASIINAYPLADRANSLSCQPLLFMSAGRSGTTLLRSMLVAGGQIAIPPETQRIHVAIRKFVSLRHIGWADLSRVIISLFESHHWFELWESSLQPAYQVVENLPRRERSLARIIDEVFMCYAAQQHPEATAWGDQSPIHTFFMPRIARAFPQGKYLHLLRDGRDAIASFLERGKYMESGLGLEDATLRWKTSVIRARALQEELAPGQFLEVRYEALVSEPQKNLAEICAFANLEYRPAMLRYWEASTTVEHRHMPYHHNIGKPVFTTSIGAWKTRLSLTQQEYVLAQTSDMLQTLGYGDV
jgi:protein-tyrosine sulfotransferase